MKSEVFIKVLQASGEMKRKQKIECSDRLVVECTQFQHFNAENLVERRQQGIYYEHYRTG